MVAVSMALWSHGKRGKSGLLRKRRRLTTGSSIGDDAATESAAENKPPCLQGKGEMVG